jgi:hypothetical protein
VLQLLQQLTDTARLDGFNFQSRQPGLQPVLQLAELLTLRYFRRTRSGIRRGVFRDAILFLAGFCRVSICQP